MSARPVSLAFASLLLALAPERASATFPPQYSNSTVPACISLVGWNNGNASPRGTFTVVIRDLANNPVPDAIVNVDLSGTPELVLCAQQLAPGITVDCPGRRATMITDLAGRATFTLMGGGRSTPMAGSGLNAGRIYANGIQVGAPTVSAYDLDGTNGTGANDMSRWFDDFVTGLPLGRSDYDCSGALGANDLSMWLTEFGTGDSALSCAASCP